MMAKASGRSNRSHRAVARWFALAAQDGPAEEVPLEAFLARCEPYFERGGTIIDQPFQERLGDGMIRCYMAADRVAGFAHQLDGRRHFLDDQWADRERQ